MNRIILIYISFILAGSMLVAQNFDFVADNQTGCDSLKVQFSLTNLTGVTSAIWDFGNGENYNGINPPIVNFDTVGVYDIIVVINGTNVITKNEYIQVYPPPLSHFVFNDSTLIGSYTIEFAVDTQKVPFDTVLYFYNWDFGDGITFTTNDIIHGHRYSSAGEYVVNLTVNDSYGCSDSSLDTVNIEDRFIVPNVFTPNDDGKNDELIIETNGRTIYSLTIFSRTGTLIYKTESPVLVWGGYNNSGIKMSPGIYFYIVEELNGSGHKQNGFFYMFYDE